VSSVVEIVVLELQVRVRVHVRRGVVVAVHRNRRQRARGFRGLYLQQAAALQGARALGLRRGVPAQQRRVFVAQARQLRALGAQLVLQLDAQFARLVEVGLEFGEPLLVAPLVARTRAYQVGDLLARLSVPAAHDAAPTSAVAAAIAATMRSAAGCEKTQGPKAQTSDTPAIAEGATAGATAGNGGDVHVAWPETYRA
jgi:hypothetical protein